MAAITTPEGIALFQMAARKGALKLEILGMTRRGRSAYSICKSEYGLRGTKQAVYDQMVKMVDEAMASR